LVCIFDNAQIVPLGDSSKLAYGFVSGVFGCAATGNNDEVFLVYSYPLCSTHLFSTPNLLSSRLRLPSRDTAGCSNSPLKTAATVIGGYNCLDFFGVCRWNRTWDRRPFAPTRLWPAPVPRSLLSIPTLT
jgi:hypothetical protein